MSMSSAEPALYQVDSRGVPILYGARDSTGFVSFPYQEAGSLLTGEGGTALRRVQLSGRGRIVARATVHRHPAGDIAVPFTVASIVLQEGPLVRGILAGAGYGAVGDTVRATTVAVPESENTLCELQFEVVSEEGPR
ncbi:Zn-ribbon domain-containing OB-fold protein [Nocardia nova]|uniref:Zn-ribbon domain-containing OB-fold protein n=1 Tax=Nocardia nova TaxID=37330 RepID=UPI003407A96C